MTRLALDFSSMDDPASGGRFGERLDTKEVEKEMDNFWASFARDSESVNRARASPCLKATLSARPRWYWAREE